MLAHEQQEELANLLEKRLPDANIALTWNPTAGMSPGEAEEFDKKLEQKVQELEKNYPTLASTGRTPETYQERAREPSEISMEWSGWSVIISIPSSGGEIQIYTTLLPEHVPSRQRRENDSITPTHIVHSSTDALLWLEEKLSPST